MTLISWRLSQATDNCTRKVLGELLRSLPALSEDVDPNPSPAPWSRQSAPSAGLSACAWHRLPGSQPVACPPGNTGLQRRLQRVRRSNLAKFANFSRGICTAPAGLGRNRQQRLMFVGCKDASRWELSLGSSLNLHHEVT